MSTKDTAVKPVDKYEQLEAELEAQLAEATEEDESQEPVEETPEEESAPSEEQEETPEETPSEEPEETESSAEEETEELTEEETDRLADKTKRQMSKLREKARRAEELEAEIAKLKEVKEVREPLEEAKQALKEEEPTSNLPWDQPSDPRQLVRDELAKERKLEQIGKDATWAESEYSELNPDAPNYDADLAKEIYQEFSDLFKADDTYRLKELVTRRMNLLSRAKAEALKKVETEAKVAKQKAEEAPPVNVAQKRKPKSTEQLIKEARSIDELEALEKKLGVSDRFK